MSAYCNCSEEKRSWFGIANIVIVQPKTEEEKKWIREAQHYTGLVICDACIKVAPWRGEAVGQIGLTGLAHILKHVHEHQQEPFKIKQIKIDLMELCKKHNIYIGADEEDNYCTVVDHGEEGRTLFKFVFANPNEIDNTGKEPISKKQKESGR